VLPVATVTGQAFCGGSSVTITGLNAYNNSYTASSVGAFSAAAGNPALLKRLILIMLSQNESF
jgi:hypothetical protein